MRETRITRCTRAVLPLLAIACGVAACAPAPASHAPAATTGHGGATPLLSAMQHGRDLGPVAATLPLHLTLDLAGRDAAALQAIIDTGGHVSAAELADRFGPDPAAIARVRASLSAAGLTSHWTSGAVTMSVDGDAAHADRFFGVALHDFVAPSGARFHEPLHAVRVPAALAPTVTAVLGFSSYPDVRFSALVHSSGMTPSDVAQIYDIGPLYGAHLDGTGLTVVFPESSEPIADVLNKYASDFNLPPFNVTVKTNPDAWGPPVDPSAQGFAESDGETEMDIEIVHAIAPGAKEVVYAGASDTGDHLPVMYQAMAHDFPNAIVSSSLGINQCESSDLQNDEVGFDTAFKSMAANGTTAYDASGDYGAYCSPGQIGVYPDPASPNVTAAGATTVFQASDGGYSSEAAWGDPVDQIGTGGGLSSMFAEPSWQKGPGVTNSKSNGHRQVPDIAGPGDPISPYLTETQQGASPGDGTSAAAPFWAGITALIYQDLAQKKLPHPALMAPVLYFFGQNPSGMPSSPFHDVVNGSNLYYQATPGWDYASGWGTPDVARLADDIEWYETTHPSGAGS